jgi:nucleotide-binding universal stress UspA family protein
MADAIRITRILVPVDPDEERTAVLAYAADLARRFGAEVILMVASEALGAIPVSEHARRVREETVRNLAPAVALLGRRDVPSRVLPYPVRPPADEADAIVAAALEEHVDLVVMATHGRRGLDRIAHLGSIAERVVRTSPCPVLVVRRAEDEGTRHDPSAPETGGAR